MAYSDYGGYAYRNGVRVEERSDFTITPDGGFGTPGAYPGFAMIAAGASQDAVMQAMSYPRGHAVLGDAGLFVTLYKQSSVEAYRGMEPVNIGALIRAKYPEAVKVTEHSPDGYINLGYFRSIDPPCELEIDGHKLSIHWTHTDNYYVFAQLVQPDGTVWTGFSGYGVGAGLEDYGYSTDEQVDTLFALFPEADRLSRSHNTEASDA